MKLKESIRSWLNQDSTGTKKFLQIAILIVGGVFAMGVGAGVVGLILIASPLLTVLILLFLLIYGLASLGRSKSH